MCVRRWFICRFSEIKSQILYLPMYTYVLNNNILSHYIKTGYHLVNRLILSIMILLKWFLLQKAQVFTTLFHFHYYCHRLCDQASLISTLSIDTNFRIQNARFNPTESNFQNFPGGHTSRPPSISMFCMLCNCALHYDNSMWVYSKMFMNIRISTPWKKSTTDGLMQPIWWWVISILTFIGPQLTFMGNFYHSYID